MTMCGLPFRHAAGFISASDLAPGTYGSGAGIMVLYGGTSDINAQNGSLLLGDMWVFVMSNNTW